MSIRRKRKRKANKRRLPRQLKTTREGKLLIGITLGLGFGAINSGNNLLYLILGMLLSLIIVSGILSELTLRGIRVRRRSGAILHAGRETFLALDITNSKKRLSSFSVEVDVVGRQRPAYALVLRPGETAQIALRLTFARRGVHNSLGLKVATRFPFSFFRKSREVLEAREYIAYPSVHPVQPPHMGSFSEGTVESHRRLGRVGEYHGLREHPDDGDPRDIHWKTSARLGRLVAREYERPADRRLWLLVPNAVSRAEPARLSEAEASISEAASLATHYSAAGWAVGVKTLDGSVEPQGGPGALTGVLDHLARVPVHAASASKHDALVVPGGRNGERLVVQHAGQRALRLGGAADRIHEIAGDGRGV